MRECRTSGSVRGALSNERPYRDYEPHELWWVLPGESPSWRFHLLQRQADRSTICELVPDC